MNDVVSVSTCFLLIVLSLDDEIRHKGVLAQEPSYIFDASIEPAEFSSSKIVMLPVTVVVSRPVVLAALRATGVLMPGAPAEPVAPSEDTHSQQAG